MKNIFYKFKELVIFYMKQVFSQINDVFFFIYKIKDIFVKHKFLSIIIIFIFSFLIIFYFIYRYLTSEIIMLDNKDIKIVHGYNAKEVSKILESEGIIIDDRLFRIFTYFNDSESSLKAGIYTFQKDNGYSIFDVYNKISSGKNDRPLSILIVPEGWTNIKIANRLETLLDDFDKQKFLDLASEHQGYLFPETYYIDSSFTEEKIIKMMRSQFNKRAGQYSHQDVVFASIIEGESKHLEDMRIISGILHSRLKSGMRLQVDVAMETYKKLGFPDNPINNPGINALEAVKNPINTDYLYYITGNDGNMYYAKTFKEHRNNIEKYLK